MLATHDEQERASQHARNEVVVPVHLRVELRAGSDHRIDLAAERPLDRTQRFHDLAEPGLADHEQIHVARALLPQPRHGTEHEGDFDGALQRRQGRPQHVDEP
jgi:hypothetical protein